MTNRKSSILDKIEAVKQTTRLSRTKGDALESLIRSKLMIAGSFSILLIVCTYVATMASLAQLNTADQFVGTYVTNDAPMGSVVLLAQHTSLMKLPLLAVQARLPYNLVSFVGLNIALLVTTCIGWTLLTYKVLRNKSYLVLSNLLLAAFLLGSTPLSIGLTMTTQRNIEYPLAFGYFLILNYKLKKHSLRWWLAGIAILGLLISSDYFFLYTIPAAVAICLSIQYWRRKITINQIYLISTNVILGVVSSFVLLKGLSKLKILSILGFGGHTTFIQYEDFWLQAQTLLHQILKLFGGDFFGRLATKGTLIILPFALACMLYAFLIRSNFKSLSSKSTSLLPIQIYMEVFAIVICLAYLFSGQATIGDANIRYLTILPFLGIFTFIMFAASKAKHIQYYFLIVVIVFVSGALRIPQNQRVYNAWRVQANEFTNLDKKIISSLNENGVKVAFGSVGYSSTTWFNSRKTIDVYNIQPCNKTLSALTNSSWFRIKVPLQRTALIIDHGFPSHAKGETWYYCPDNLVEDIYGIPSQKITAGEHLDKPVVVWIYDYDIRSKMVE